MWASKKLEIQVICKKKNLVIKKNNDDFHINAWNFIDWKAQLIPIEVYK